jgi:hypothetical protein
MSPLTVFIRTLAKSTAIFLGAGLIFLNPSLEVTGLSELKRLSTGGSIGGLGVTAQKSPAEQAVDALIGALKDTDAGVRRQAAHTLGEMHSAQAVPALMEALKDQNAEVRTQAM